MIFASATDDIVQDDPVTTTFSTDDAHQVPAQVAHEDPREPQPPRAPASK